MAEFSDKKCSMSQHPVVSEQIRNGESKARKQSDIRRLRRKETSGAISRHYTE